MSWMSSEQSPSAWEQLDDYRANRGCPRTHDEHMPPEPDTTGTAQDGDSSDGDQTGGGA